MLSAVLAPFSAVADNPFLNSNGFYVQPDFSKQVATSITGCKGVTECKNLQTMQNTSTAFWVDKKAKVDDLKAALATAAAASPPQLFVTVLYNLPNRDCDAFNSVGEICCYKNPDGSCDRAKDGDCNDGLQDYFGNFADPIADAFKQYEGKLPIVAIIEPDSLPNLATNLGNPNCANLGTSNAYNNGIPYIIKKINSVAPSVTMYIDAAHGGWLGWPDNAAAYTTQVNALNVWPYIRGFATNVANYQPLGSPCPAAAFDDHMHVWCEAHAGSACCGDPCNVVAAGSGGNNEYNYVQALTKEMKRLMPKFNPFYLIDTSRNGVPDARQDCAQWCNPHNAGAGHLPSSQTLLGSMVDAMYWIKPPGQSDGCTNNPPLQCTEPSPPLTCKFHDAQCDTGVGSQAGEPCAPEAGDWFDFQAKMLAQNGNFAALPPIAAA